MSAWTGNPCRLCLNGSSMNQIPDDPLYLGTIFDASGVKVSPNDELPQQLCNECLSFINQSRIFRKICHESQNSLLKIINKSKSLPEIKKETKIMKNKFVQLNTDILIKPKIEKIHIEEIYTKEVFNDESKSHILQTFCTINDNSDAENMEIYRDPKNLNLDSENLNQDHRDLNSAHEDPNLGNEDLNLDYEDLESDSKSLKEGSIKDTNTKNILTKKKCPDKAKKSNNVKCKICGKEMLPCSMRSHLKRHKLYGEELKKGSKMKNKQMLVECDACGKRMPKKHLLAHFLIHNGKTGQLICKHCDKSFDRPFGLLRHCRAKHGYARVDKCSYCDFMGCTEYEVRVHEKLHTGDSFACDVCGKTFIWKNAWLQHKAEHGDPKILCSECPEIFRSTRQLARHISQKHKPISNIIQTFQCPHCTHTALHKSTIVLHMKNKHGASNKHDITKLYKNQSTDTTEANAKIKNYLKPQKKVTRTLNTDKSNTKSKRLKDDRLSDRVNFLSAFHKHLDADSKTWQPKNSELNKDNVKIEVLSNAIPNTVDKSLNLQNVDLNVNTYLNTVAKVLNTDLRDISHHKEDVTTDNAKFKVDADLDANNEDLHCTNEDLNTDKDSPDSEGFVGEKTIKCEVCNKTVLKQNYSRHKKGHDPNFQSPPSRKRPYVECEVCGTMVQEHNLKEHLAIHQGTGKKIPCELHERKHTGERPFVCSICGAAFRFPSSRQKHMAERHGKGKMVQCEVCAETFLTPRLLSSHKYTKHSTHAYSYQCALCHKVYKRRGAARRHLLKNHDEPRSIDKIIKVKLGSHADLGG